MESPRPPEASDTMRLTNLPVEMIENVFSWLDPDSLFNARGACRLFHDLIQGNQTLCRSVYLSMMDVPGDMEQDWERELISMLKLRRVIRGDADSDLGNLSFVLDTVDRLLRNASYGGRIRDGGWDSSQAPISRNVEYLRDTFTLPGELTNSVFLQQSSLFERMRSAARSATRGDPPTEETQMSAKLHCLYGRTVLKFGRTRSNKTYPYACSKVYDIRQYTERTKWGPFRDDGTGRVDWEKVEAITIVIASNIMTQWPKTDMFDQIFNTPFYGSFPRSYVPRKPSELTGLDAQDPYGVSGWWYRIVCFLDYSDFFHYNFSTGGLVAAGQPRPPLNVGEATRLIIMDLRVVRIEPPGEEDGQGLPVVHYEGNSRSLDDSFYDQAHSGLRGSVRLTKEGEVRWTSVSIFNGEERWRSEGVQVGGPKSARGVVGSWFDRGYDVHGPAGPTLFWKAADSENPREALLEGMRGPLNVVWTERIGDQPVTSDDELGFMQDDDDDDEDDWDADLEPIADELPGLLQDAEMDLMEVTQHQPAGSS